MMVLLGAHGGDVLFVIVVVLQPRVVHAFNAISLQRYEVLFVSNVKVFVVPALSV